MDLWDGESDTQDAQILDYMMQNKAQNRLRQLWEVFLTELDTAGRVGIWGSSVSESTHRTFMCANLLRWLLADDGRHSI